MPHDCYDCGCSIPKGKQVRRNVAVSSTYIPGDGSPNHHGRTAVTYARVSLCRACNESREQAERGLFALALIVVAVALTVLAVLFLAVRFVPPRPQEVGPKLPAENEPRSVEPAGASDPLPAQRHKPHLEVAPPPNTALTFKPPADYISEWRKLGIVEARVCGIAVTRVPVVDGLRRLSESPLAVLAIWVEVRTNATTRKVELRRWQGLGDGSKLVSHRGIPIPEAQLGPEISLQTGLPYTQRVLPNAKPRAGVLVFSSPVREAGDLMLVLDADRVGETGTFTFHIPRTAFAP